MPRTLRRPALVIASALLTLCSGAFSSARADSFSFTTSGVFSNIPLPSGCAGNGTNELRCADGRVLIFNGTSFAQDFTLVPPQGFSTSVSIGTFQAQNLVPSDAVGPLLPSGITLTITINLLGPEAATGSITGFLDIYRQDGFPAYNFLSLNPSTLLFEGTNTRTILSVQPGFFFPNINNAPGFATVLPQVPEPATLLLLGTGLAGIGAAARKRRMGRPSD